MTSGGGGAGAAFCALASRHRRARRQTRSHCGKRTRPIIERFVASIRIPPLKTLVRFDRKYSDRKFIVVHPCLGLLITCTQSEGGPHGHSFRMQGRYSTAFAGKGTALASTCMDAHPASPVTLFFRTHLQRPQVRGLNLGLLFLEAPPYSGDEGRLGWRCPVNLRWVTPFCSSA